MTPRASTVTRGIGVPAAFCLVAACTPDTEAGFREEVEVWLALADTVYFNATRVCTAAIFETRSGQWTWAVADAQSWTQAQMAMAENRAVAFENISLTPSDFTGIVMDEEPDLGNRIISAGLAVRDCMDAEARQAYLSALRQLDATLLYDPATQTVGVLRADRRVLFIGRGEPK